MRLEKFKAGVRDPYKIEIEEFKKEIKKLGGELREAKVEIAAKEVLLEAIMADIKASNKEARRLINILKTYGAKEKEQ